MKSALVAVLAVAILCPRFASGGPVILGGDDLTDHGCVDSGVNEAGWLYIEKAVGNILNTPGNITRPGNDGSIAALGSAPSTATCSDAGAAIGSAAAALGKTVTYYDGAAALTQFFNDLTSGNVNPAMLWIPGTDASNDLDSTEGAVLAANAQKIAAFVASGGGLMAHGCDGEFDCQTAYGWLTVVLPGIVVAEGCTVDGAMLTPLGQAAFPGLSDADIQAGPCHNHFEGDFGGLGVLARDGEGRAFILGGGSGTTLLGTRGAPIGGPTIVVLLSTLLALLGIRRLRMASRAYPAG